jgi:thiol-disulfide isomerase/thioredoxin
MKFKLVLFSFSFFLILNAVSAQEKYIVIPLRVKIDSSLYMFMGIQPGKSIDFARVPDTLLGIYTLSRYLDLKSINRKIPVLTGVSKDGRRLIIFDRNNNHDFRDDTVFYFDDTLNSVMEGNYKRFSLSFNDSLSVSFDYSIIKPQALHHWGGDKFEENFDFGVRPEEYRIGEFDLGGIAMKVILITEFLYRFDRNSTTLIVLPKSQCNLSIKELKIISVNYRLGDKMKIGDHFMVFQGVSATGNSLRLQLLDDTISVGNKVGFVSPKFRSISILNDSMRLVDFSGRYVLLEYWGTWCGPCKMVLPGLKTLHHNFGKVKMIGIAYDNDVDLVKHFVLKEGINWDQVFVKKSPLSKNSLCTLFEVENYPSFFIIDPDGKIIFRDMGIDGFNRMVKYMKILNL